MPSPPDDVCERLRVTLELAATGLEMMRHTLARRHPGADAETLEQLYRGWLEAPERWGAARPWRGWSR